MRQRNKTTFTKGDPRASAAGKKRWADAQRVDPAYHPLSNAQGPHTHSDRARIQGLPRERLIAVLDDPRAPHYARVQAAKELHRQLQETELDEEHSWKTSVQVREDFVPPDWDQVMAVAVAAGSVSRDKLRRLLDNGGSS
jgi:hypothetical protein